MGRNLRQNNLEISSMTTTTNKAGLVFETKIDEMSTRVKGEERRISICSSNIQNSKTGK